MAEQAEEQETEKNTSQSDSGTRLKRIVITIIFLVLFIPFFGKLLPSLLFGPPPPEKNIGKIAKQEISPIQKPELTPPALTSTPAPAVPALSPDTQTVSSESEPPEAVTPPVMPSAPLEDERIRALEEKIARLEAAQGNAVSNLENKIDTQNSELQNKTSALLSSLIVFGQMRDALRNGEPYDAQLEQLKKFTEKEPQAEDIIAKLAENSANGIATPAKLKERFNPLAKQVIVSLNKGTWVSTLQKFITIRKIGDQVGDDDEAVLARAEVKLAQGDLSGSLKEIVQLSPESQEIFTPWVRDAQNWLDANDNLGKLQLLLTQTSIVAAP